ncbi:MAG: PadR family transcriptional regulator [Bryobacteraceae bacterium]|nr:PadR family transcriptional regulator [Bryobacteraceae bacterium]
MKDARTDILRGTLDLLIMRTLKTIGPSHGWGIARRLEQVAEDALRLNQGTVYPALVRLEQRGWIKSSWGISENNRRARFYALTPRGEKQLAVEEAGWDRIAAIIARIRSPFPEEGAS